MGAMNSVKYVDLLIFVLPTLLPGLTYIVPLMRIVYLLIIANFNDFETSRVWAVMELLKTIIALILFCIFFPLVPLLVPLYIGIVSIHYFVERVEPI